MRKVKRCAAIMLSLLMALGSFSVTASAADNETFVDQTLVEGDSTFPKYEAGQLIVVTEKSVSRSELKNMAEDVDGELDSVTSLNDGAKAALLEVEEGSEISAMNDLSLKSDVLFVQPNYIYELEDDDDDGEEDDWGDDDWEDDDDEPDIPEYPDDPAYQNGKMRYLSTDPEMYENYAGSINAAGAWEQLDNMPLPEEEKVLVGVVDTGVRRTHQDLQGAIVTDKCVTFNDGEILDFQAGDDTDDDIGHGTNVSGVIAADINNGLGGAGVAGGRAKLIVVDACTASGKVRSLDVASGIYYLVDEGVRLINLSVGGCYRDYLYKLAVTYAWNNGVLCICSAGNSNSDCYHTPGDNPFAMTVMSHEWEGVPTSYTCYGYEKDISAPGSMLYTTSYLRDTSYESFDGTSAATPVAVGAAALLLSANPELTPREIMNLLYTSSGSRSFFPEKEGQGFGRINLDTAMKNMLNPVKEDPDEIVINKTEMTLIEGAETYIEYAVYPGNTNKVKATFSSSNPNAVTVSEDGLIVANEPGESVITVSCGGVSEECKVTVLEKPYTVIDKKPYSGKGTFSLNDMVTGIKEDFENPDLVDYKGFLYHEYRVELEKDETVTVFMNSEDCDSLLRFVDEEGDILKADDFDKDESYSMLSFKAEKAGTYILQAIQINAGGKKAETEYELKIVSDKALCEPKITSKDFGQLRMTWKEVDNTDYYIVRKYTDKSFNEVVSEDIVDTNKYTDTSYNEKEEQYYSITACMETIAGTLYNGETKVVVEKGKSQVDPVKPQTEKKKNTLTVKAKKANVKASKLNKKNVTLKRNKVLNITKAKGKVTYAKKSGNKKISINKKTGKVTVKKGLKKGKYKVKVQVKAAGDDDYKPMTKKVTFIVIVK